MSSLKSRKRSALDAAIDTDQISESLKVISSESDSESSVADSVSSTQTSTVSPRARLAHTSSSRLCISPRPNALQPRFYLELALRESMLDHAFGMAAPLLHRLALAPFRLDDHAPGAGASAALDQLANTALLIFSELEHSSGLNTSAFALQFLRQLKRLSVADRNGACIQESLHLLSGIGDRFQPLQSAPASASLADLEAAFSFDDYSAHSFERVPELGPSDVRAIETVLDLLEPGDKPRGPPSSKRLSASTATATATATASHTPELAIAYLRALCYFLLWLDARNRRPRATEAAATRTHRRVSMKHSANMSAVEEEAEPESASTAAELKPFLPPPPLGSLARRADDIAMSIHSSEVGSVNEQMFDADTESKTASESVTLVAQQQQLSQYESLVGSASAWHEGHSARGQCSDAQLRLLEQRFADNIKPILVALKPPDADAGGSTRLLSSSIEILLLRCYLEMLVSREQRAPAADLVAAFVSSRQAACTSGSEREQLVRLLVDLVQQLYSRAPPSPELESVPAPESGREFREQSLASSEEGSVADAQVADIDRHVLITGSSAASRVTGSPAPRSSRSAAGLAPGLFPIRTSPRRARPTGLLGPHEPVSPAPLFNGPGSPSPTSVLGSHSRRPELIAESARAAVGSLLPLATPQLQLVFAHCVDCLREAPPQ